MKSETRIATRSWRFSPSSHEWHRPSRVGRSGRPRPRTRGCSTVGWDYRVDLSVNVKRWLRSDRLNGRVLEGCFELHARAMGPRLGVGDAFASPFILADGSTLVVRTRCYGKAILLTTVHIELKRGRKP